MRRPAQSFAQNRVRRAAGDGALLQRGAERAVPGRGAERRGAGVAAADRGRRRARVRQRGHVQLAGLPGGHGLQPDLPVAQRVLQEVHDPVQGAAAAAAPGGRAGQSHAALAERGGRGCGHGSEDGRRPAAPMCACDCPVQAAHSHHRGQSACACTSADQRSPCCNS